jgi:hypothetical protein
MNQSVLETLIKYKDSGLLQVTTGRKMGKSYFSSQAFQRLWDDLHQRPIENLVLSDGTVYGSKYYTVEPVGGNWPEMELWALQTYGETGSLWRETKNLTPEPLQRWYMNNRKFWFRDERDRTMFILRWS